MIDLLHSITPSTFISCYVNLNRPILLKEYTYDLVNKWNVEHIKELLGDKRVNVQIMRPDKTGFLKTSYKRMSASVAMDKISMRGQEQRDKYYISGDTVKGNLTPLRNEISHPDFLSSVDIYDYGFWYGEAGNITPLHLDCFEGVLHQIKGKKIIRLYAPEESKYLYLPYDNKKETWFRISKAFRPLNQETYQIFPQLMDAKYVELELNPGDLVYIPCGWWHYVYSSTECISLNYIWRPYFRNINLGALLTRTAYLLINRNIFSEIFETIIFSEILDEIISYLSTSPTQQWLIPFFLRHEVQKILTDLYVHYNISLPSKFNIVYMLKNLLPYLPKLEKDLPYCTMLQRLTSNSNHLHPYSFETDFILQLPEIFKSSQLFSYYS